MQRWKVSTPCNVRKKEKVGRKKGQCEMEGGNEEKGRRGGRTHRAAFHTLRQLDLLTIPLCVMSTGREDEGWEGRKDEKKACRLLHSYARRRQNRPIPVPKEESPMLEDLASTLTHKLRIDSALSTFPSLALTTLRFPLASPPLSSTTQEH